MAVPADIVKRFAGGSGNGDHGGLYAEPVGWRDCTDEIRKAATNSLRPFV
jgi:hypothetical protein